MGTQGRWGALGLGLAIGSTSTVALARGVPPMANEDDTVLTEATETLDGSLGSRPASSPPLPPSTSPPPPPPVPAQPSVAVPPSLPWSLRPPAVANVVRLDGALGIYRDGVAFAPTLLGMVKIVDDFGAVIRVGVAHVNAAREVLQTAFDDVAIGLYCAPKFAVGWRASLFAAGTLPVGTGGGSDVTAEVNALPSAKDVPIGYKALGAAAAARGSMDNMLYAVNYVAFAIGAGMSYAAPNGVSVQFEGTVFGLGRIGGVAYEPDEGKINFTTGVHVGHTLGPVNLSLEVRYQRWLSTPVAVEKDDAKRDTLTAGIGARTRFKVAGLTLRPGIAYFEPLDDPLAAAGYHMLVFDVPVVF